MVTNTLVISIEIACGRYLLFLPALSCTGLVVHNCSILTYSKYDKGLSAVDAQIVFCLLDKNTGHCLLLILPLFVLSCVSLFIAVMAAGGLMCKKTRFPAHILHCAACENN